jgi:hypothetical protein
MLIHPEIQTLAEVISTIAGLLWKYSLYLPADGLWDKNSRCCVLDPEDCEEEDDEPVFARQNGLKYALSVNTVQQIVDNAREQIPDVDIDGLMEAFFYYYDNDAFIEFSE